MYETKTERLPFVECLVFALLDSQDLGQTSARKGREVE